MKIPKTLYYIMILTFFVRAIPLLIWQDWPCIRDECTYLRIADRMVHGEGMTASAGWLWAPGYPTFVALHQWIFGHGGFVKGTQIILSVAIVYLLYLVAFRTWTGILGGVESSQNSEESERDDISEIASKIALFSAFLYACSPTQIFFADSLWSECIYGGLLLLIIHFFQKFVDTKIIRYLVYIGIGAGICVLFRGVATYMIPIFLFALLWKQWTDREAYRHAAIVGLVALLTVLPYSTYISQKFDRVIISDRTLGQMMWLGNNDFLPVTFDSGNGQLSGTYFSTHTKIGRKPCGSKNNPMKREDCQTQNGKNWILEHPTEFVSRMPLRVAQMLNPHSFLTRHLRAGYWRGIPQWADEIVIVWNVVWNLFVLIGGSTLMLFRAKGQQGILLGGILIYHVAAISALAGLTRYRVPLEPILMIYAGGWFGYFVLTNTNTKTKYQDGRTMTRMEKLDVITKIKIKISSHANWKHYLNFCILLVLLFEIFWFFPMGWPWWRFW